MNRHCSLSSSGVLFALLATLSLACQPAHPPAPVVEVESAWARPSRPMMGHPDSSSSAMMTSAVYLTLRNHGAAADTLVGAATDAAEAVEIHQSQIEDGVMRMRQVHHVELPAGESVDLRPGGLHVMLIGLTRELAIGEEFEVTLEFAQSGAQPVQVAVRRPE